MIDPISFTASLVAILGTGTAALKYSISFYELARAVKSASDDIERFALDIRFFGTLMKTGYRCLETYYAKEPNSQVLNYFEELQIIASLSEQSKRTKKRIRRAWHRADSVPSGFKIVTRLKWIFRKGEVEAIYPDMERLKTSLQLIMTFVNFEAVQKRGDSEEARREM